MKNIILTLVTLLMMLTNAYAQSSGSGVVIPDEVKSGFSVPPSANAADELFLNYSDGMVYYNNAGSWDMITGTGGGGGATTWLALTDTDPTTYTGQSGKVVVVNGAEDGLEFVVPSSLINTSGDFLTLDPAGNLGLGVTPAQGAFHIQTVGVAGFVGPDTGADEIVIENNGGAGMTIVSGPTSIGAINFSNGPDNDYAEFTYNNGQRKFEWRIENNIMMNFTNNPVFAPFNFFIDPSMIPVYADQTAAGGAGLIPGYLFQTATGQLMIKN